MAILNFSRREESGEDAADEVKACVRKLDQCQEQVLLAYVGHPAHGKSDCQNTAGSYSCWPHQIKQIARAGKGDTNITKGFTEHKLEVWNSNTEQNRVSNVVMVDTPGQICKELMLDYAKVKGTERGEETINNAVRTRLVEPLSKAGVTALVIVVNARLVWKDAKEHTCKFRFGGPLQIPPESRWQTHASLEILKKIQLLAGDSGIRPVCMLTHVDLVDKAIRRDVRKLAGHSAAERIKQYVAQQLGLKRNQVHAVVNLQDEYDPGDNMELGRVALRAFCHAVQAARDGYIEVKDNQHLKQDTGLHVMMCPVNHVH